MDTPLVERLGQRELLDSLRNDAHALLCNVLSARESAEVLGAQYADFAIRGADHARPFLPAADRLDRAQAVVEPLFVEWVQQFVGETRLPPNHRELEEHVARECFEALAAAGLLMPPAPVEHPLREELIRLVQYANSRTVSRDGVMGGGYYSAYVSDEDVVDTILVSGLLDT